MIDDISYLAPDTINGLNLYAYCGNNPVMNVDTEGTSWWSKFWNVVGAIAIVVGITALTVVTAGAVAVALGASAAMVSAVTTGAMIGGLIAGGGEIINQLYTNGAGNINLGSIAIETFVGAAYGVISGITATTASSSVRQILRGARIALSGVGALLHGLNEEKSFGQIVADMGRSMAFSFVFQRIGFGINAIRRNIKIWT